MSVFSNPEGEQQTNAPTPEASSTPAPEHKAETAAPVNLFADQLAGIKTEDGRQKYADVPTALNSISHSQAHIAELTRKNKELEETLAKQEGMEQLLERIESTKQTNTEQPSVSGLSEADVASLVDRTLQQKEAVTKAQANETAVTSALIEKFGSRDTAVNQLGAKAAELGVDISFLQQMAQHSPKAVLDYFNTSAPSAPSPTGGGVNTEALNTNITPEEDPLAAARAKLLGETSELSTKWRAAAPKISQ